MLSNKTRLKLPISALKKAIQHFIFIGLELDIFKIIKPSSDKSLSLNAVNTAIKIAPM
ncbi:MAG: hypothetical protein ACJAS9_001524 [Polaribacter sp.]|jgi:hypothetical protein